jgi:hypothetical protein
LTVYSVLRPDHIPARVLAVVRVVPDGQHLGAPCVADHWNADKAVKVVEDVIGAEAGPAGSPEPPYRAVFVVENCPAPTSPIRTFGVLRIGLLTWSEIRRAASEPGKCAGQQRSDLSVTFAMSGVLADGG